MKQPWVCRAKSRSSSSSRSIGFSLARNSEWTGIFSTPSYSDSDLQRNALETKIIGHCATTSTPPIRNHRLVRNHRGIQSDKATSGDRKIEFCPSQDIALLAEKDDLSAFADLLQELE